MLGPSRCHGSSIFFDSLKHTKNLEGVGFSRKQAEKQVEMIMDVVLSNLATTEDMRQQAHQIDLLADKLTSVEQTLNTKIDNVEERLTAKIEMIEKNLLIKLAKLMGALLTLSLVIIGFMFEYYLGK